MSHLFILIDSFTLRFILDIYIIFIIRTFILRPKVTAIYLSWSDFLTKGLDPAVCNNIVR